MLWLTLYETVVPPQSSVGSHLGNVRKKIHKTKLKRVKSERDSIENFSLFLLNLLIRWLLGNFKVLIHFMVFF